MGDVPATGVDQMLHGIDGTDIGVGVDGIESIGGKIPLQHDQWNGLRSVIQQLMQPFGIFFLLIHMNSRT